MNTQLQVSAGRVLGLLMVAVLGLLLVAQVVGLLLTFWPVPAAAGAALAAARWKRWPDVGLRAYLTTQKAALPAAAGLAGGALQAALENLASPLAAVAAAVVAAAAVAVVIRIFEGRTMKNVFDLVPSNQRGLLDGFLKKGDAEAAAGPTGQHADFSRLDAGAVTGAINASVVGQPAVVGSVVATAFRRARLARPHKPVAVFLFVGATGAGKTELAKALAGQLFGGRMIRLDCAEMSSDASVQRLIGSPPGYIGSEAGGWLCRELARVGTGVLLFDEIEKAHPAVLKAIMGLLDEARLTEQSTGTTYSATGFVIVLTSNAQQAEIAQIAAATPDDVERSRKVHDELKAHGFLPEILARIDAIFPFAPLSRAAVVEIVGRALQRQATGCGVELEAVDAALLIDLVTRGETLKDYGVRELLRQVEAVVTDGLLDARDRGETRVAIRVDDAGAVHVEAVEARP